MDASIDISSQFTQEQLQKIARKQDWSQELHDVGILLLRSVDKNFTEQGRPNRWTQSKAARTRNGMTLVDTSRLRRSVTIIGDRDNKFKVTDRALTMSSGVDYAKYLHEDRPFFIVQDEDIKNIEKIIIRGIENL